MGKLSNRIDIELSEHILAGEEVVAEITTTVGKEIRLVSFKGEASFNADMSVRVIWDYGEGKTNQLIWHISGSSSFDDEKSLGVSTGEKIAVILDNSCIKDSFFSAKALIKEYDV